MAMTPLTLNINAVHLTDEQFYKICQNNRELKFERTSKGKLVSCHLLEEKVVIGKQTIADLVIWNRQTGLGFTFSSSTIFAQSG